MTDSLLQAGIARARSNGATLVRVMHPLDCADPWSLLPELCAPGTRVMAWSAPASTDRRESFVAIGAAVEHRPAGPDRFRSAAEWWSALADGIVALDGETGGSTATRTPACLAGFAFSHSPNRSAPWQEWGDGALCVPEILIWHDGAQTTVVLSAPLDTDPSIQLRQRWAQVQHWLAAVQPAPLPTPASLQPIVPGDAWNGWRDRVQAARTEMANGAMDKVVLARAQSYKAAEGSRFDPAATAMALRERQASSTSFLVHRSDGQAFLGSTPEILVRLRARSVETVAMAGTRKRGDADETEALSEALMSSEKDRHEQALVTEALRAALTPVTQDLQVPDTPDVVRLPDVQHLRSRILGTLDADIDIFALLDRLHPTPAVGGLPRVQALAWLDDHEALDRGWYAGPIGWVDRAGDGEFVVAIRSALMTDREAAAFAGCGVVVHSDAQDEWDESVVKLATMRSGLALRGAAKP